MTSPCSSPLSHADHGRPGDLIENLGLFCRLLRERGVTVALDKEIDAASALLYIDLLDPEEFHVALKATLLARRKDEQGFDELFWGFWRDHGVKGFWEEAKSPEGPNRRPEAANSEGSVGRRGERGRW